jgi:hypothetical protein
MNDVAYVSNSAYGKKKKISYSYEEVNSEDKWLENVKENESIDEDILHHWCCWRLFGCSS